MKAIKTYSLAVLNLLSFTILAQPEQTYNDGSLNCKYQSTLGMLNGPYVSYYKNGVKKSEGNFQFNNRIGEWSVWDSTGKLRVKRNYSNPYEYTQIIPVVSPEGPIPLLNKPVYKLERDSLGEWKYFKMEERMVIYSQRNFKCFYTSEKQQFFHYKMLFEILYENALNKNYPVYAVNKDNDDETYSKRFDISTIDTSKIRLVGFRIKSDYIFDNSRFISQDVPLFITILAVNKGISNPSGDNFISNDTVGLYSIYYRDAKKYLAQVELKNYGQPPYLQNLDDIFFFGCYGEEKWNVSNMSDRGVNKYIHTPPASVNQFILKEVETENDMWLYFNK